MDTIIFGTINTICDTIHGAGATTLWADLCATQQGQQNLYYVVMIGYGVLAVALVGAIAKRFGLAAADDTKKDREEPR